MSSVARFFDSRAAYLLFSTATNEKPVVASRIEAELDRVEPGEKAIQVLDAGMGDATVLAEVMRGMHRAFTHVPWLIVGKEISIEDVRLSLDKMADRLLEHPETVFVVTNMSYREAPSLTPLRDEARAELRWTTVPLEGSTSYDFSRQIRGLYPALVEDWYAAYRAFARMIEDPAWQVRFKLEPGDLFVVDNRRVLHGRTAFAGTGQRHLQGCYADMDGLRSRLAVLERASATGAR